MRYIKNSYCIILAFILSMALGSCVSDDPTLNGLSQEVATFVATIDTHDTGSKQNDTRAVRTSIDDQWSYLRFDSSKDTIGFFSLKGNLAGEDGNGPFMNEPMVFTTSDYDPSQRDEQLRWRGVFSGVNMDYDLGMIQQAGNKTFVYYPYAVGAMDKGLMLRQKASDGSLRCVDALQIQSGLTGDNQPQMSGTFSHAFSELMMVRGYGFDNPKVPEGSTDDPWKITVVLNKGYSHAKIELFEEAVPGSNRPEYWYVYVPVYDESCGMTELECRRWEAWRGTDYKENELSKALPAYYCILPTGWSTLNSVVDYIELYDNLGVLRKVTSFYLRTTTTKNLYPTHLYRLNIVMEGLVPTIYPYTISEWDNVTNITDARPEGINSTTDFQNFVSTYNSYINTDGSRNSDKETDLERYGTRYEKDGQVSWHFYLNKSLDISTLAENVNYRIFNLCDTLDGVNHFLNNLRINGNSGFIGELRSGACLMNMHFSGLSITNQPDYSGAYVGGLVNQMTGGLIYNCNVNARIASPGRSVGMGAAYMTSGQITGCTFTGVLAGGSTYNGGILATEPSGGSWQTGNSYSCIAFTELNE